MSKNRLEAFSDGVIAILLTIMVLGLVPPHSSDLASLRPLLPTFSSYVLSFILLGIYWNNHHHLLQASRRVNGRVLWANLHLLFWLSLIPFVTSWAGSYISSPWPVAAYGAVFLGAALAYRLLTQALVTIHEKDSPLVASLGGDTKGKASLAIYLLALALAFVEPWVAWGLYVLVAAIWLVPDARIEKKLS